MDIILKLFLPISLGIIMFSLGISLTIEDFKRVVKIPAAITSGLIGQMLVLPVIAFGILHLFPLEPALAFGIMLLALSPGGVTSNMLTRFAGGSVALSVSLTAVSSVLCVFTLPLIASLSAVYFLKEATPPIDITLIGLSMAAITVVPVAFGVALHHMFSDLIKRLQKPISYLATVLFLIVVVGAIAANLETVLPNIAALAPILILLNVTMLFLGYYGSKLANLSRKDSSAIALEIGIQNATLGITVGGLIAVNTDTFPEYSLPSGIYAITMYLCGFGFIWWNRYTKNKAA